MSADEILIEHLNAHEALCQELLDIVQGEAETLRRGDNPSLFELCQRRKSLLPRLDDSVQRLRDGRTEWRTRSQEERDGQSEVRRLLRRNQELCLKIMVLDRENEQKLLQRGMAHARPPMQIEQPRPNFVAQMYKRQSRSSVGA